MSDRCTKCGSVRLVPRAPILDRGDSLSANLQAYVYRHPDALLLKGTQYATLFATICADCGFTEIYAEGASELYDAYREGRRVDAGPAPEQPKVRDRLPEEACLSCGKPIPSDATACPACGWTWGAEQGTA